METCPSLSLELSLCSIAVRRRGAAAPAAGSFVGAKVATFNSASDQTIALSGLTGGLDTAPAAGDTVVVGYATGVGPSGGTGANPFVTAGYTATNGVWGDSNDDIILSAGVKVMGGSPDASVVVTGAAVNAAGHSPGIVIIQVFRGVNAVTPLDVAATTAVGSNSVVNPAAITPVTASALLVVFGGQGRDSSVTAFTNSDLTNFVQINNHPFVDGIRFAGGYRQLGAASAYDPVAWGGGNVEAGTAFAAITLALRPA